MIRFADEATIEIRSGNGGNGCVAFRREKYVPKGGPAGGDGGRGGNIVFCVKRNLRTLSHLRYRQVFKARNGGDGEGSNRHGSDGGDAVIFVPPGTILKDTATGEIIRDFANTREDESFVFLTGGKGGWGNTHFKSSVNQTPQYAHEGTAGETRVIKVELNIMADIGLVGFPNAGKSSLLDYFTAARPKIAPYPFTTKIPNLGVLHAGGVKRGNLAAGDSDSRDIIIADIPGILEGASGGVGLGFRFLKHISRTAALLFIIDCADESCFTAYDTLCHELDTFSKDLLQKKRIVLCNKIDVEGAAERAKIIRDEILQKHPDETVIPISIYQKLGLKSVKDAIIALVEKNEQDERIAQGEYADGISGAESTVSGFLASRSTTDETPTQYPGEDSVAQSEL